VIVPVIDLCGQELCTEEAEWSFVFPGHPRKKLCDTHLRKLRSVAEGLGLSLESLDIQPHGPSHIVLEE